MSKECPNCRKFTNSSNLRLVRDSCGHSKCRMCLVYEEQGCKTCGELLQTKGNLVQLTNDEHANIKSSIIGNEIMLPLELVINKNPRFVGNINSTKSINSDNDKNSIEVHIPTKIKSSNISSKVQMHLNDDNDLVSQLETDYTIATSVLSTSKMRDMKLKSKPIESVGKEPLKDKHLKSPNRNHISIIPGTPEKYKCNICSKIFKNKKGRCYHDSCVTGIKPYQCTFCDRSFAKRSHFEYHERVHSGYKPYRCNICEKAFPQRNKLNRHMYSHNKEKQFICPKCKKKYSKQEDLKNHLNSHNNSLVYTCKTCEKSFYVLASMKRHMKTHTDERPYCCDQCNKSFKDKSLLIRHKRIHQKDRPFSCAHCNRVFLSKSELRRHLTVHSDDKPFTCEFCQTVFRRKDNLNRHIRHHHTENSTIEINRTQKLKKEKTVKTEEVNSKKHKQKGKKKIQKVIPNSILKFPSKVSISVINSHEQINSRLDSMGNITPVIRTTTELSNAVPVINGPICIRKPEDKTENHKKIFTYTEPIPLAEAVVINRRIEEKLYPQSTSRYNYFLCNYINHSSKQHSSITTSSLYTNQCTRTNHSNLNSLSSEFATADRTNIVCQTAELNNLNLVKNAVIQRRMYREKSDKCSNLKAHEVMTYKTTNDFVIGIIDLKDYCSANSNSKQKTQLMQKEQTNCVSTIKKTYNTSIEASQI